MPGASIRDQAVQILTRGARAWQQLAESFPSIPAFRSDLAAIYTHISELYYDQPEELLRWQSKALNIRQELVAANGSLDRYREDLATSLLIMGIFHERSGRGNESRTFLREAVAQSRRLLNGTPKSSVYREFLAQTTRFLMNSEPAPERERLCRESRQLFEDLFSEYPTVPLYMHGCALLSLSFAGIVGPKSPTEAEAAYRRSLELSRRLISESPENGDYRWMLRTSASELAQWLANNGRPAEAVAVCRDRINAFKAIQSSRADDSPLQLQVHRELGWAYGQLAWILELDKQESDANVARRDSLAEWEICLATTAPRPEDVHGYSEALHLVPKPGETPVERVSRFERCVDLEQKALAARPSDKDYRQLQGYHYWALGGAYEAVGDDKKAGEALRHSIELWESLANPPEYLPKVRDQHARIQLRTEHAKEAPGASTKEEPMKHE
jgi:tetratricopeptide (TPR) repeat protein